MLGAVLGILAAIGTRLGYPALIERRAARRRPLGPDGIIKGASPVHLERAGAPAVLLLHGGGDTPQTLGGLARFLHDRGYAVRAPLMASHGRAIAQLATASASQWLEDAVREYDALRGAHGWVGVVGLSMGGALAVQLATRRAEIPCLVLLAPYLDMPRGIQRLARTTALWGWLAPYLPARGERSIRDREAAARALGHGMVTPALLRAFYETMRAASAVLPRVTCPVLMIQSREDNRITAASASRNYAALGAVEKRLEWLEGAGHVITVDFGHERVFALTAEWLDAHRPVNPDARAPRNSRQDP